MDQSHVGSTGLEVRGQLIRSVGLSPRVENLTNAISAFAEHNTLGKLRVGLTPALGLRDAATVETFIASSVLER